MAAMIDVQPTAEPRPSSSSPVPFGRNFAATATSSDLCCLSAHAAPDAVILQIEQLSF